MRIILKYGSILVQKGHSFPNGSVCVKECFERLGQRARGLFEVALSVQLLHPEVKSQDVKFRNSTTLKSRKLDIGGFRPNIKSR
jgi:hypothetical protein